MTFSAVIVRARWLRKIRRGLLKGEQLHSLAKDIFYAKRGRVSARGLQQRMNSCSCLTLSGLHHLLADETGLSRANRENPRVNKLLGSGLADGTEQ